MSQADQDPSAELERRAEEATVAYEQNMLLRAAVVAIPVIGSSLDLALTAGGQRSIDRIHKLIDDLKVDMQERLTVEGSAFNKKYLESEEFYDLFMRAFDASIKTRDEENRRLYARILTESTILDKTEGHSPEEYLDLIANLTPRELAVARALYRDWPREGYENRETKGIQEAWRAWLERVSAEVGIDEADLQLILGRLQSSGLITEDGGLFPRGGGPIDEPPQYWVSIAFEKLMQFLERRWHA
jgi:hypothetical protein